MPRSRTTCRSASTLLAHHRVGRIGRLACRLALGHALAGALLHLAQRPQLLLDLDQEVAVGFPQRLGRLTQRVILAELVRHTRKHLGHGQSYRFLRVAHQP